MKIIKKIIIYLIAFIGAVFALFILYLCICRKNINYFHPIEQGLNSKSIQEENSAYNFQFKEYEGEQSGEFVKNLITAMCLNINVHYDDNSKLPDLIYKLNETDEEKTIVSVVGDLKKEEIAAVRSGVLNSYTYLIELEYSNKGLVDKVIITKK